MTTVLVTRTKNYRSSNILLWHDHLEIRLQSTNNPEPECVSYEFGNILLNHTITIVMTKTKQKHQSYIQNKLELFRKYRASNSM